MKLGNFFTGNVFTITQSPHGALQGGKAIDCVPTSGTRVIAPCDMEIYYRKNDLGHQSYSYARGTGFRIIFVHAIIEKTGFVKRGTDIGYLATGGALHLHTAIEVNGVWDTVLNYMERTIELRLSAGFQSQHWKSWSTWKDLSLNTNNMATHCIPLADYEYGKAANLGFFQQYADANAHKTMDGFIWYVKHGVTRFNQLLGDKQSRIEELELIQRTLNGNIEKLNASIGGLTTDRNKYKSLSEELQAKLTGETEEKNRLKIELEDTKKEPKQSKLDLDIANNELANTAPKITELTNEVSTKNAKIQTQAVELTKMNKALAECKANKGTTLAEFLQQIINKALRK